MREIGLPYLLERSLDLLEFVPCAVRFGPFRGVATVTSVPAPIEKGSVVSVGTCPVLSYKRSYDFVFAALVLALTCGFNAAIVLFKV